MTASKRATLLVVSAYLWWGFSPVFWRQLKSIASLDQLAWRVSLGLLYLVGVWLWRRQNPLVGLSRRHLMYGVFAAVMIATNWAGFLWAVDNDQTVESALGYFLMPLLSVALGVGLLGEELRPKQWIALALGAIGLVWTIAVVGGVPWVALVVGGSFTAYGWARKQGPWGAADGLTFELTMLTPVFAALLVLRGVDDSVEVSGNGSTTTLLLIALTGLVTVVPLLLFASAARQVPLSVVGLLQYINPVLQFLVGWQLFGEDVRTARLLGFAWIWVALALVVSDEIGSKRPVDGLAPSGGERSIRS